MRKLLMIILIASLFGSILLILIFWGFSDAENNYGRSQDDYFSKVTYHFEGKIVDYQYLGGVFSLVKIQLNKSSLEKIELEQEDDFVGIYDRSKDLAYMIIEFNPPVDFINHKISKDSLPQVLVNSTARKIIYSGAFYRDTVSLRLADVYTHHLRDKEQQLKNEFRF